MNDPLPKVLGGEGLVIIGNTKPTVHRQAAHIGFMEYRVFRQEKRRKKKDKKSKNKNKKFLKCTWCFIRVFAS